MAHGYADIAMQRYRAGPLNILIFKNLAGLWWAGEVVNHIWICGSKVAEGSSSFQRRSCYIILTNCVTVLSLNYYNHRLMPSNKKNNGHCSSHFCLVLHFLTSDNITHTQIARFMWPIWGTPGPCRPQMGPMLAPWTLLSG